MAAALAGTGARCEGTLTAGAAGTAQLVNGGAGAATTEEEETGGGIIMAAISNAGPGAGGGKDGNRGAAGWTGNE
jgi:hypothetical protein